MNFIIVLLIVISVVYIYIDAVSNKIGKVASDKGFLNISAGAWAVAVLGLWIIAFPLYLINRRALIEKAIKYPVTPRWISLKVSVLMLFGAIVITISALPLFDDDHLEKNNKIADQSNYKAVASYEVTTSNSAGVDALSILCVGYVGLSNKKSFLGEDELTLQNDVFQVIGRVFNESISAPIDMYSSFSAMFEICQSEQSNLVPEEKRKYIIELIERVNLFDEVVESCKKRHWHKTKCENTFNSLSEKKRVHLINFLSEKSRKLQQRDIDLGYANSSDSSESKGSNEQSAITHSESAEINTIGEGIRIIPNEFRGLWAEDIRLCENPENDVHILIKIGQYLMYEDECYLVTAESVSGNKITGQFNCIGEDEQAYTSEVLFELMGDNQLKAQGVFRGAVILNKCDDKSQSIARSY